MSIRELRAFCFGYGTVKDPTEREKAAGARGGRLGRRLGERLIDPWYLPIADRVLSAREWLARLIEP